MLNSALLFEHNFEHIKRREHIRRLLVSADEALRGGVKTAVMESVIAAW